MEAETKELLKSLDHTGGGSGHPNTLCAKAASAIRELANGPFWLVECYFGGRLHYWSAGAAGRGSRDGWSTDIGFATKLADHDSAEQVLFHICGGDGRSVQHAMLALA